MVKFAVEFWWKMFLTISQQNKLENLLPKLRRKFATNFAENFAQLHSGNRWCLKKGPEI